MKTFLPILLFTVISSLALGQVRRYSLQELDSIRDSFNHTADSLQTQYHKTVSGIDARATRLTRHIDSVQQLNLSTNKYTKSLDSLNQYRLKITTKLQSRLDSLKSKTIGKLTALDLPPEYKKHLEDATRNIVKLRLGSDMVKIPKIPPRRKAA